MQITDQTTPFFAQGTRDARALVKHITPEGMTLEPEKTEEEIRLESSSFSVQRRLTPEEENRVLFLQNLLAQTLAMAGGNPTEEQRARIRDIENEMEEITGVKVKSSLSASTKNLPGKKDEDEEEQQPAGIDPKEAVHARRSDSSKSVNPGMQMLQQNAALHNLKASLDTSDLSGSGLSGIADSMG